jgi:hypothetical protein
MDKYDGLEKVDPDTLLCHDVLHHIGDGFQKQESAVADLLADFQMEVP